MYKSKILLVNAVVVIILSFAIAFYLGGFVWYPIPSPDSRIQVDSYGESVEFDVHTQGLGYEEATIIDETHCGERNVYLLKEYGELHLVNFEEHPITGRLRVQDDILIEEPSGSVTLKNLFFNGFFEITDGRISNISIGYAISKFHILSAMYVLVAIIVTALETFLLSYFLKRKNHKESTAS